MCTAPLIRHARVLDWLVLFCRTNIELPPVVLTEAITALDDPSLRGVISAVDHDGVPMLTVDQLDAITKVFLSHDYPVAVITAHRATLAVIKAICWKGARANAYRSEDLPDALEWLGVAPEDHAHLIATVKQLRADGLS